MREIVTLPDPPAVAAEAARRLADAVDAAVRERQRAMIALAGGTTPALLYRALSRPPWRDKIPWRRLVVFWGDERCVPPDHPDSNFGAARREFLQFVPIPKEHVHRMAGELEPAAAAADYAAALAGFFGETPPRFDMILLGMGQDGHIASLFPGAPALELTTQTVAATLAPAGQARLTLTLTTLNAARHILVLVVGAAKAGIVRRALGESVAPRLPAQCLAPAGGSLIWLLDSAAAAGLT